MQTRLLSTATESQNIRVRKAVPFCSVDKSTKTKYESNWLT